MKRDFLFIGHRGTRSAEVAQPDAGIDENTLLAFRKAIDFGANCIEFDVRKTKDEFLILFHDEIVDRTTNLSGRIEDLTYAEVKKIRTRINHEKIPLLADILDKVDKNIIFMIDLKGSNVQYDVLKLVKDKGLMDKCIFSGRCLNDLKYIKENNPESKTCYNITKGVDLSLSNFLRLGRLKELPFLPDMISLQSEIITENFIKICHLNKILALSWNFLDQSSNSLTIIKSLIRLGLDGILFDDHKHIKVIHDWFISSS